MLPGCFFGCLVDLISALRASTRRACVRAYAAWGQSSISILLLALFTGTGFLSPAFAATLCDSAPSSFRIDSLLVREPEQEQFVEANADNFCYQLREYPSPGVPEIKNYDVSLNLTAGTNIPAYPAGTKFRFTLVNLDTAFKLGGIISTSPTLLAFYADQTGGSAQEVSVQGEFEEGQTLVSVSFACT